MEEWKEYRLGDILSIKSGFSYKGKFIGKGNSLLLGMGCVSFKEKFLMSGARPYSGPYDERYKVHSGDIVLATRQQSDNLPILAMPAMVPDSLKDKDLVIGTNLYKVEITDTTFSNVFIYWLLKTKQYVNYIAGVKTGTTVSMVTKKNVEDFTFFAPSNPKEREKIASIISSLDDKITVNKKICENLEAQAQALFKHWFVDFVPFKDGKFVESELGLIPEGWRVGTLGDIADITMGQSPAGSSYNEKGEGIIFYQGRTEFGFRYPSVRLYTTEPKRFAEPLSTLLSVRAPVGDINVAIDKCCIGRGLASIKSNKNCHSYIYYLLQSMKRRFDVYNGEGTVFGSINKDTLNDLKIIIPSNTIILEFEEIVGEMDKKILESHHESLRLSTLRDTLLPKLMSGEIKLNEYE